jgi:transcriptional regulator with XRE-family HTH domain
MSSELSWSAVGKRLELLRKAYGVKQQKQFAELIQASGAQYNNWALGRQIIPVEYAVKICGLTGATLDYIYLGKSSGLPMHLVSELNIIPPGLLGKNDV